MFPAFAAGSITVSVPGFTITASSIAISTAGLVVIGTAGAVVDAAAVIAYARLPEEKRVVVRKGCLRAGSLLSGVGVVTDAASAMSSAVGSLRS